MRRNGIVLYDMEIENAAIRTQKITGCIFGVLFLLASIGYCLWLILCYRKKNEYESVFERYKI